jgi:hypothetical protein
VHGVGVRGQAGGDLGLHVPDRVGGVRRRHREERHRRAVQQPAASLEGGEGVVDVRRAGVGDDRLDLGQVLVHPAFERGQVVLVADLRERRQPVRQRAGGEQGVLGHDSS